MSIFKKHWCEYFQELHAWFYISFDATEQEKAWSLQWWNDTNHEIKGAQLEVTAVSHKCITALAPFDKLERRHSLQPQIRGTPTSPAPQLPAPSSSV